MSSEEVRVAKVLPLLPSPSIGIDYTREVIFYMSNYDFTELQLLHQQQAREKREAIRERKYRAHRLIVRGAIAEGLIAGAEGMTDEEFQEALSQACGRGCDIG